MPPQVLVPDNGYQLAFIGKAEMSYSRIKSRFRNFSSNDHLKTLLLSARRSEDSNVLDSLDGTITILAASENRRAMKASLAYCIVLFQLECVLRWGLIKRSGYRWLGQSEISKDWTFILITLGTLRCSQS